MTFLPISSKLNITIHILLFAILSCSNSALVAKQRFALVIGNAAYSKSLSGNLFGPLNNPLNDAKDITEMLQQYGFTVKLVTNATKLQMDNAINQFIQNLQQHRGVGLFYYSGHGVQVQNINYLIPINQAFRDTSDIKYHAVNAQWLLDKMEGASAQVNIMILDACREPLPFVMSTAAAKSNNFGQVGLAKMGAKGVIIGYATTPGMTASDGTGRNGLYTQHLLNSMNRGDLAIEQVLKQAGAAVAKVTHYKQVPWVSSALFGNFCFGQCGQLRQSAEVLQLLPKCQKHLKANRLTRGRGGNALACYQQVLNQEPTNIHGLSGFKKIEARYLELIKRALDRGQKSKAKQYLANLQMVHSELQKRTEKAHLPPPSPPSIPIIPQPIPSPSRPSPQDNSGLLQQCQKHLNAHRLVTGEGGTAFACYKEVLKNDPTNTEALVGLKKIEARYVTWLKRALAREQVQQAKAYLDRLRTVNPASLALPPLEAQLKRMEEAAAQLLQTCQAHLKANRLTTGKKGTAFACYQQILSKDKTHPEALAGLREIEARYTRWFKRALDRKQHHHAKQYLERLRQVNPKSPTLPELEARLGIK